MSDQQMMELKKTYDFYNFITNNDMTRLLDELKTKLHFKNRFFNDNHPVFAHIKKLFDDHKIVLAPNELLFRARKIKPEDERKSSPADTERNFYGFNKKDSFVPQLKKMKENRANAKGIPCLYTAREQETAIAEVRPFAGNKISVAKIQLLHDLKIFDLFIEPNLSHDEVLKQSPSDLWFGIAFLFSIPYEDTSENEYLLTQCISEYIQLSGFDGIQYSSSLNEGGKNIVLFNCKNEDDGGKYNICEPICSNICTVKNIEHNFEFYN